MEKATRVRFIIILCMVFGAIFVASGPAFARKPLFAGKAQGMATVDINNTTLERVEAAIQKVFANGEGFSLTDSGDFAYVFQRPGGRIKDLSYGVLGGEGVVERAVVEIEQKSDSSFRVECNVYMVRNSGGDPFFEDETKVLRAFGREYKRLLRRVQREANRK